MLGRDCLQLVCGSHIDQSFFWKDVSVLGKTKTVVDSSFFISLPSQACN